MCPSCRNLGGGQCSASRRGVSCYWPTERVCLRIATAQLQIGFRVPNYRGFPNLNHSSNDIMCDEE
jgi:hypothetical protein